MSTYVARSFYRHQFQVAKKANIKGLLKHTEECLLRRYIEQVFSNEKRKVGSKKLVNFATCLKYSTAKFYGMYNNKVKHFEHGCPV